MAYALGRKVNFGMTVTQRSDRTWASDYTINVLDDELMPETGDDLESFLRKDIDIFPALRGIANAAAAPHVGNAKRMNRLTAIMAAMLASPNPQAVAWKNKRNCRTNPV